MPFPFINHLAASVQRALSDHIGLFYRRGERTDQSETLVHADSASFPPTPGEDADPWAPDNYYYAG